MIRSQPLQNMSKFKDHPPVVKDFYDEHADITTLHKNDEEEAMKHKTPEELEDLEFEQIPKPVQAIDQAFQNYPEILAECKRQNFNKPTPIQAQIWPILLKGLDCIGIAQTGTGKTLGFLLPALVHIDNQITPRDKRGGPNVNKKT